MQTLKIGTAAALAALLTSTSASAELQSWTMVASINDQPFYGIPDSFSHPGQEVRFDFLLETQTEKDPAAPYLYAKPLRSLSIDGMASQAVGTLESTDDYQLLNAQPVSSRADGVTDMLLYTTTKGNRAENVMSALYRFSAAIGDSSTGIVLQFSEGDIWMTPLSLQPFTIPEPTTGYLMAMGMVFVLITRSVIARVS